jgi:hypothetical protein
LPGQGCGNLSLACKTQRLQPFAYSAAAGLVLGRERYAQLRIRDLLAGEQEQSQRDAVRSRRAPGNSASLPERVRESALQTFLQAAPRSLNPHSPPLAAKTSPDSGSTTILAFATRRKFLPKDPPGQIQRIPVSACHPHACALKAGRHFRDP